MKKVVEFSEENPILCLATVSRNQKAKRRPFMCAAEMEALVRQKKHSQNSNIKDRISAVFKLLIYFLNSSKIPPSASQKAEISFLFKLSKNSIFSDHKAILKNPLFFANSSLYLLSPQRGIPLDAN